MSHRLTLAHKLTAISVALLLLAFTSLGVTLWLTWEMEGGAAALNEAGRMRMQTYRLALAYESASKADLDTFINEFENSLRLLHDGDASRPLFLPRQLSNGALMQEIEKQWLIVNTNWSADIDTSTRLSQAHLFVGNIEALVRAIESDLTKLNALLTLTQLVMAALVIASATVLTYIGYMYMVRPIKSIRTAIQEVEQGNFMARIHINSHDEIGDVASGFNQMAKHLGDLYQNLERRVTEKTAGLEVERARLAALYEISALVANSKEQSSLAQRFADKVRSISHADASAVRWTDEAGENQLLIGSSQLPDFMIQDELCLPNGGYFCWPVKNDSEIRCVPIRLLHPRPQKRCRLAGYQTVVAIPIKLHQRQLGELNLFYKTAHAIELEMYELLSVMSRHLATGIESLRTGALEREAAVGDERNLLARELHDSIAQTLAFLNFQVQLLREARSHGNDTKINEAIDEIALGVKESNADVRELLIHFRTRTNQEDFLIAIKATLSKFEIQTGTHPALHCEDKGLPLPPDIQIQLLHIVQEALSNIRKHAQASHVSIWIQQSPHWEIRIQDNGKGFITSTHFDASHVGISIMKERAHKIDASVHIQSALNEGTTVTVTLPQRTNTMILKERRL